MSELMMLNSPVYGKYDEQSYDLYKDVMKKSEQRKQRKEQQNYSKREWKIEIEKAKWV